MLADFLYYVLDPEFAVRALAALGAAAAVVTVAVPIFDANPLKQRMKVVSVERKKIRARERARLDQDGLRDKSGQSLKRIAARLNLSKWVGTGDDRNRLAQAGHRKASTQFAFLLARVICPMALGTAAFIYIFGIYSGDYSTMTKAGGVVAAVYAGFKLPDMWLNNLIEKRKVSIRRAFPDALDLLLICVESGMPIEQAFKRVNEEIGVQSVPLAEELVLTTAELSYLPDRRMAYENLGMRTGLEEVRNITTVLVQAENYGTPLGTALRVVSQESRDTRMMQAEKKAAALPPKLTVPMILFFLPVLFAVILTPAFIQIGRTGL